MSITGKIEFRPKLWSALRHYNAQKFQADLTAGVVVGIVALPLAIAFAIASGVSPAVGLITAILGGFMVSAFGGNSVQIGGPTGAFIVIVYGIIARFGVEGLAVATLMAGLILVLMGLFRLGTVIKFIPYPIVIGFTAGIALTIFSTQINDFFGLGLSGLPSEFLPKMGMYLRNLHLIDPTTLAVGLTTLAIIILTPKVSKRLPGALIAIVVMTTAVWAMTSQGIIADIPTIGSRFTDLRAAMPALHGFSLDWDTVNALLPSAFTIAMLGAIESLLSATVADGVTGSHTRTNTELIGQGMANILVPFFGGIPVTGAIARTMTNITNGGRTPVAGIIHAVVLLIIFICAMPLIKLVPMACLAAVLIVVAYNMSGWRTIAGLMKAPKGDISVLIVTFLLTVVLDLTIAIEIGMLLAVVLFLRRVMENTQIKVYSEQLDVAEGSDLDDVHHEVLDVRPGVQVYEIDGPFFFGVATKFDEMMRMTPSEQPLVRILRMRKVPFIDSTAIHNLEILIRSSQEDGIHVVLSGVRDTVRETLEHAGIADLVGEDHVCSHISKAVEIANSIADGAPAATPAV